MTRAAALAAAAAALGALAAAAWFFLLRDVAEPVSVDDVLTTFREETDAAPGRPSPVPEGVYVFDTAGFEKTDALRGVTHRYPARSTITVTSDPCGVRMRWDVLDGRSTTWTYCVEAASWSIASQDERHTFFGRTERTTYRCRDTRLRDVRDLPGATFAVSCSTGSAEERGRLRVVGRETLSVGARRVVTVHLRKRTVFTGDIRGKTTHDLWLARESGVPVRVVMLSETANDSAVGDVHYEEDVELRLRSLRPRR